MNDNVEVSFKLKQTYFYDAKLLKKINDLFILIITKTNSIRRSWALFMSS
jgi:hypothetical protein